MEELKPCPFCGGEARLKHGFPSQQKPGKRTSFVQCKDCKAKTETIVQVAFMAWKDVDRYAVEAWNRRPTHE